MWQKWFKIHKIANSKICNLKDLEYYYLTKMILHLRYDWINTVFPIKHCKFSVCHSNIISSRLKSRYNWLFSQKNQNVSPNFPGRVFLSIYMRIQYSRSFYRNNEVHLHKNPYIRVSKRCCFHFGLGSISPTFHKMVSHQ